MKNQQAIGLFDSGIGGTSIWKEVVKILPNEHTIYLADSKNAPYGQKTSDQIIELSVKNTELLISKGCKLIIVACNTATTNAIDYLRSHYNIPFIGIEPAIKPAALFSKTEAIGILATKGTLTSKLFEKTANEYTKNITTIEQDGEGLVELIEDGKLNSPETQQLLTNYLSPMLQFNIDHLVLGCTHYPYLIPQIKEIVGPLVHIIDSGEAAARQTKAVLEKHHLLNDVLNEPTHQFYTNTKKLVLENMLKSAKANVLVNELDF
ncbi:glutamate racemase [Lutibacter agarilyticus]|uniref:Glutamate racemase n=1 Tax=Lutibacter agarilyticus TaxID=1109740 RepID=A0A238YB75_9FLAO|nr:glutamate racemase [Lutibacter agarilyticus]SNR67609.1 glutamate racemase [Lutibacter agarilyticus]